MILIINFMFPTKKIIISVPDLRYKHQILNVFFKINNFLYYIFIYIYINTTLENIILIYKYEVDPSNFFFFKELFKKNCSFIYKKPTKFVTVKDAS